jgi:hypothetical protein
VFRGTPSEVCGTFVSRDADGNGDRAQNVAGRFLDQFFDSTLMRT